MKDKFDKIWKDPVWSNVIAFVIISILTYLASLTIKIVNGLSNEIPIEEIVKSIKDTFTHRVNIPTWTLLLFVAITATVIFQFAKTAFRQLIKRPEKTRQEIEEEEEEEFLNPFSKDAPIFHYGKASYFFAARLGKAFPGLRSELKWYKGKDAVDRLEIVLQKPLDFRGIEENTYYDPIWWFRAGSSNHIKRFKRMSRKRCLMNLDEIVINKIAVFHDNLDYRHFIYVETLADKPSGAYPDILDRVDDHVNHFGYSWEEYGLLHGRAIKREEHDDGSAEMKGKVVDATKSILRSRYLSPYNFIITPKDSPFNSKKFDRDSKTYLNGLLSGTVKFDDFVEFMKSFDRHEE